jgi:hypothetical protein
MSGAQLFDSEDWQMRLALTLGVNRSTIQFWRNGKMRFGPDHPALVRLLELADRRAEEITKARDELRDWLASQPPEDQA